jgi:hypothetical protein
MAESIVRKCPFCSGDMLKGKPTWHLVYTPPWTSILSLAVPKNKAYPWACLSCGVVLLYLDSVPLLAAEYKRNRHKKAKLAPAAPIEP